jgi:peptide/nickel transport system ATP-binding protein
MSEPILSVRNLRVYFEVAGDGWFGSRKVLRAVDGVSFDLDRGETLGIVGECSRVRI